MCPALPFPHRPPRGPDLGLPCLPTGTGAFPSPPSVKVPRVQLMQPPHCCSPHCPSRPPWSDAASATPSPCLCTAQAGHLLPPPLQLLGRLYL